MRKRFRRLSIVHKITLLVTAILIAPALILGATYFQSYLSTIYSETNRDLEDKTYMITRSVDSVLETAEDAMNDIEYSQELMYFLDGESELSDREKTVFKLKIQNKWLDLRKIYPNLFTQMVIYTSNDLNDIGFNWKFSMRPLSDFKALNIAEVQKDIWFGNVQALKNDEEMEAQNVRYDSLIYPVYMNVRNLTSEKIVGIVELDIPFEKFISSDEMGRYGEEDVFVFLNQLNRVVYQIGNHEFCGEDFSYPEGTSQEGFQTIWIRGEEYLSYKQHNNRLGLTSVSGVKKEHILAPAKRMVWRVGLVALIASALVIGFIYILLRKALNRLVVMDEAIGQIERGQFDIRFEDDGYEDEISRMKWSFQAMADRLQMAMDEAVRREQAQKEAELMALQAQINPHFLFNTLETMRMQCEIDRYYKISNALLSLSELFHYTLRWKGSRVEFSYEWEILKSYLSLMKLRWGDDLSYELYYDEELQHVQVPKMFLQPLVENSFQHGFKGVSAPWKLLIRAEKREGKLVVTIRDNGTGVEPEELAVLQRMMEERKAQMRRDDRNSIGIVNVLQRMDRICGEGSDIRIENGENGGIQIQVVITMEE